ncbi:MAG: hypothetical protein HRU41_13095 [Saprospiraceae bacterium]|nr:hypothetical protein [Saprospiraceae bacterium]
MNSPIVNNTFQFVQYLYRSYLPKGFDRFEMDQAVFEKNAWVSKGRRAGLSDTELETLALTALLHRVGIIETFRSYSKVSRTIAERYLKEQKFPSKRIASILHAISVANKGGQMAHQRLEQIILSKAKAEVVDIWP